jgi:hypothetical protein
MIEGGTQGNVLWSVVERAMTGLHFGVPIQWATGIPDDLSSM